MTVPYFAFYVIAMTVTFYPSVKSEIVQEPKDTEVLLGHSTYFSCSTSSAPKEIFWYHYHVDSDERHEVYEFNIIYPRYKNRIEITKNSSEGVSKLLVDAVRLEDAGRYECIDENGGGYSSSAQLVVLETIPVCQSDIQPDGVLGPNDCDLKQDKLQMSCSIAYRGNIPPQIEWLKVGENQSFSNELVNDNISDTVSIYTLTLESALDMDNSSYMCRTLRSATSQYSCIVENINVIYALGNSSSAMKFLHDIVICVIKSSQSCDYSWSNNLEESVAFENRLTLQNVGWHECRATCIIRNYSCIIKGMKVNVIPTDWTSPRGKTEAAILVPIILIALVVVIASSVVVYRRRKAVKAAQNLFQDVEEQPILHLLAKKAFVKTDEPERTNENVAEEELQLLHKIKKDQTTVEEKPILGVAILNEKLFLVREKSSVLEVYNCDGFLFDRKFPKLKDLVDAVDICSCKKNNCLYIMDKKTGRMQKEVLKIDTEGKLLKIWPTLDNAGGYLSSTEEGNVIITVQDEHVLLEYTQDGEVKREIKLPGCINPWHAIKNPSCDDDHYFVSHGTLFDPLHRVCLVEKGGIIEKKFGRESGSTADQLNMPFYLAVGSRGFVVVADLSNNRMLLLDSNLEFKAKLVPKYKQRFRSPRRVYLDETEGLLIVIITAGDPVNRILSEEGECTEEAEESDPLPERCGLLNEAEERIVLKKTKEVDAPNKIEEDCRILAFNIRPLLEKY